MRWSWIGGTGEGKGGEGEKSWRLERPVVELSLLLTV